MTPIATEIAALREMDVAALVDRYETLFGRPPRSKNREHLWRRCAWKIQERKFGGLSGTAKRHLDALMANVELPTAPITAPPQKRGLTPGTVISRDWHGRRVEVRVMDEGFEFEGAPYRSLSAIAKLVTGTNWNGPAWFGIRERKR